MGAFDTAVAPDCILVRGSCKNGEKPGSISAELVDNALGLNDIVLRLRHFLHTTDDHRQTIIDSCCADSPPAFVILDLNLRRVEPLALAALILAVVALTQQHALSE
ncbi:hypothetical protein D3C80_1190910 [compost metagenome]